MICHNTHRVCLSVQQPLPSFAEELHVALGFMEIKTNIGEKFLFLNDKINSI